MTHPADPSSPHQPVAQTEAARDKSMTGPRKTVETIVPPQDRSKATPPQSPSQQKAPRIQGENVLMFEGLYLNFIKKQETRHKTKSSVIIFKNLERVDGNGQRLAQGGLCPI